MISHKLSHYENIQNLDDHKDLIASILRLKRANDKDNKPFNTNKWFANVIRQLENKGYSDCEDRARLIFAHAMRPYSGSAKKTVTDLTGADLARTGRKITKKRLSRYR